MNLNTFQTASELAQYVTDEGITPANTRIWEKDGLWYLFWW